MQGAAVYGAPVTALAPTTAVEPRPRRRRWWLTALLVLALAPAVVVTVVRWAGVDQRTPFAQLVSVTPWLGVWTALVLVAAAALRRWWVVGLATLVVVVHLLWLAPLATGSPAKVAADPRRSLRVMTINAYLGRADADEIVRDVRAEHVQVLAVEELSSDLVTRLHAAGLDDALPYHVTALVTAGPAGTGLWTVSPLSDTDEGTSTWFAMPSGVLDVGGSSVRVMAVHTAPPTVGETSVWMSDLRRIRDLLAADTGPELALGDFNATRDHSSFRDVLGDRFVDAADAGDRLTLTWPTNRAFPPMVGIDHVVVDRGDRVQGVDVRRVHGSDHAALLATVTIPAG
jgi:endonuclease/exonuclease/phosphatase (EEP) superfamily protein YafD